MEASTSTQPNILMFVIDNLGCRDLSCYGSSFYETPNLDRLAAEGLKFDRAYASCPVCSPTRASLLSGQYPARVGVTDWIGAKSEGRLASVPYLHYLPLEQKSIASALREGGYQTWHVGKWHLGDEAFYPEHHGFDINIGGCHWGMPKQGFFSPWNIPGLKNAEEGTYLTDYLTDESIRLIRERDPERPFFLNLWHYAVHAPIQAPEALVEKYREKAKRLKLDQIDPFVEGEYFPCVHKSDQKVVRRVVQSDPVYAAMIENMDTNIGRVLDALESAGLAEDTLVMFTSDNGGLATAEGSPTCNAPMREGKGWAAEGGLRVCQLARWPGRIPPGSISQQPVISTDFYPTMLEAAGLDLMPDQHADGVSLLASMTEAGALPERPLFWHYPHYSNQGDTPSSVVLEWPWKLIQWFERDQPELFHLEHDISETTDLAKREPEVRDRLMQQLQQWQQEIEATVPEPNPEWESKRKRPHVANNAEV
jgi:arylsulfatase A-like enzyme